MFFSVAGKPSIFPWCFSIQNRFALHGLDDTNMTNITIYPFHYFCMTWRIFLVTYCAYLIFLLCVSLIWAFHWIFFSFTFFIFDTKAQGARTFSHYSICITWLTTLTLLCQRFNFLIRRKLICRKIYFFLMRTRCNGDGYLSADSFLTLRWFCWFPKNYIRILHFSGDGGWVIGIFNWWTTF